MADSVQFNVNRINDIKDEITSSIKMQGTDALENNCRQISSVLTTKNEEMVVIYSSFNDMQEVINDITEMMNEDPEAGDSVKVYTKRM